jgi:hypothetical protein
MEQRPLRLGDILDDYCPRERRVTNHAIVAMLDATVKQTRCTTCDAEHPYKGGQAPRRRSKAPEASEPVAAPVLAAPPARSQDEEAADLPAPAVYAGDNDNNNDAAPETAEPAAAPPDEGPVHRRLIRATLPRQEGQKETRPMPEFTIRQPTGRNGNTWDNGNHRGGARRPDGARPQRLGARSGGQHGRGAPPRGQGTGSGRPAAPPRRSGRKRSR